MPDTSYTSVRSVADNESYDLGQGARTSTYECYSSALELNTLPCTIASLLSGFLHWLDAASL
ncbi:hypothetical protein OH492_14990 [Vibrio chagasii]|nr:hypothetical protein [Vibrio chagasii]